jgi:hypothetical protein
VNDYIDNFIAYMLHVSITSELHQVNLFVTGALQAAVVQHHPWEMEVAILLARAQENLVPTTIDPTRSTLDTNTDTNSDHPVEEGGATEDDSAHLPTAAASTPQNTPVSVLLPRTDYNLGVTAHPCKMQPNSMPPPASATTTHHTHTRAPAPPVGYNTIAASHIDNTPDQAIFA